MFSGKIYSITWEDSHMYSLEEFDKEKAKVLKYILYKKRTENEVRTKFQSILEEELLEDIIEYLKEAKYIDDTEYIQKIIHNFKTLKNLSMAELKYKLLAKGLNKNLIEDYFYENQEELTEYEINAACHMIEKKKKELEAGEIKKYLLKKGYKQDNIKEAFERQT